MFFNFDMKIQILYVWTKSYIILMLPATTKLTSISDGSIYHLGGHITNKEEVQGAIMQNSLNITPETLHINRVIIH